MSDFSIFGEINGDSSGFREAVAQAKESLTSLTEIAGGVFAGMGAASLFEGFTNGMKGMVGDILETGNHFQTWGTVINNVAGNASTSFESIGDAASGAGAKAALGALEAQIALENYNDKVKKINDEIRDVMKGQNILDEQKSLYAKLSDLAQQHADKVKQLNEQIDQSNQDLADREANRRQSMNDTLTDMVDNNEVKKADTAEKRNQEMLLATNDFTRNALLKRYAAEDKLTNDSFQRQYDLKKKQLQRNLDEANAADEKQTSTKLAKLTEQINKENNQYDTQQVKLKQQSDERVTKFKEENDKKFATYQEELAKEDRAYQESMQKRALSAASSGGGGGGALGTIHVQQKTISGSDSLSKTKTSAEELHKYLEDLSDTTPFKIEDIEATTQQLELMGIDAKQMLPTIMNLSGSFQQSLGTTTSDVLMAMRGQTRQLGNDFGITSDQIEAAFGPGKIKSANEILTTIQGITQEHFGKGIDQENQIAGKHMAQLENQVTKIKLGILGFNDMGQPDPNGLFSKMLEGTSKLADYLREHRKDIIEFVMGAIGVFEKLKQLLAPIGKMLADAFMTALPTIVTLSKMTFKGITDLFNFLSKNSEIVKAALIGIAAGIGLALIPALSTLTLVTIPAAIAGFTAAAVAAAPFIIAGLIVAAVALAIFEAVKHWDVITAIAKNVWGAVTKAFGDAVSFIKSHLELILLFLGPAGWLVVGIMEVYKHWGDILKFIETAVANSIKAVVDTFNSLIKGLGDVFKNIGDFFNQQTKNFLEWGKNLGTTFINGIKEALKNVGSILTGPIEAAFKMFKGKSPPTEGPLRDIDDWGFNIGSAWVGGFRNAITNLQMKPSFNIPGMNGGSTPLNQMPNQVYNSTTNAPQITQTNTFNVKGEANAQNIAQYLGFQLEHKGLV